eukprot:3944262-Pleurochrysis_carterae.AAC.3
MSNGKVRKLNRSLTVTANRNTPLIQTPPVSSSLKAWKRLGQSKSRCVTLVTAYFGNQSGRHSALWWSLPESRTALSSFSGQRHLACIRSSQSNEPALVSMAHTCRISARVSTCTKSSSSSDSYFSVRPFSKNHIAAS